MRSLSLQSKMLLGIGAVVVFGLALTIGFIAWRNDQLARAQGLAYAHELSATRAEQIANILDSTFTIPRTLARTLEGSLASDTALTRDSVNLMLRRIVETTPEIFGVWTCWGARCPRPARCRLRQQARPRQHRSLCSLLVSQRR